jgi:hypothetical protein
MTPNVPLFIHLGGILVLMESNVKITIALLHILTDGKQNVVLVRYTP